MGQVITQVDAFADRPFIGNPAAVCILDAPRDAAWMQQVAREMNLSETAFLEKWERGYGLRWFTPAVEVDLCGHATLASAHVLWEQGHLKPEECAIFQTKSGQLTARKSGSWIEMDFPALAITEDLAVKRGIEEALGMRVRFTGRSRFDVLAEVESEQAIRALDPDLGKIVQMNVRGLIVTSVASHAVSGNGFDYVSRFFAPGAGVPEDPVTGSAHCVLAPYWKARLGRDGLVGYQASERGGIVRTRCQGDRVMLGGQAVTVMRGELV